MNKIIKTVIVLFALILFSMVAIAVETKTVYNPFSGKLDFISTSNFSTDDMTVGNLTVLNKASINNALVTRTLIADVINGTQNSLLNISVNNQNASGSADGQGIALVADLGGNSGSGGMGGNITLRAGDGGGTGSKGGSILLKPGTATGQAQPGNIEIWSSSSPSLLATLTSGGSTDFSILAKESGNTTFGIAGQTTTVGLRIGNVQSAVNHLQINSSLTGQGPTIGAFGSDANVDLNLKPKGIGSVNVTQSNLAINSGSNITMGAGVISHNGTHFLFITN